MTPLRQRFLHDLQLRNYAPRPPVTARETASAGAASASTLAFDNEATRGRRLDRLREGTTGTIIQEWPSRRFPMTDAVRDLLRVFDSLSPSEQDQATTEILRRGTANGGLPDAAQDELAAELFRAYDAEEAARDAP
jgi:hypothetical protein